tara:strand:+ start:306 stop:674 length:369 start_codon:yes stop_codon:yes gene_type:complete
MNVTNIREKHPSTQRAYMGLKVASRLHADVAADVIAAPPAGYCINIWGVFFLTNAGTIEAIGIGDGVITPISVAATKYSSMNLMFDMPVICGDGLGVDTIDTHSADGSEIKLVSIYYTIVPV